MQAPYNIVNYRREQCKLCPTPCEFQMDVPYRTEGDNACPKGRWMDHKLYVKRQLRGLGDVVAAIANPIAGASDALFNTKLRGCNSCRKRKEMLNMLVPFVK